jgi:putative ABC transport system substrate-binding protein
LWTASNTGECKSAESAAEQLRVQLIPLQIGAPADFPPAFQATLDARADALITSSGPVFSSSLQDIAEFAASQCPHGMYYRTQYVDAGGLVAYGIDFDSFFKRSAVYVYKILRGAQPADPPIEQPTALNFAITLQPPRRSGFRSLTPCSFRPRG